jgi:hypothetical protein
MTAFLERVSTIAHFSSKVRVRAYRRRVDFGMVGNYQGRPVFPSGPHRDPRSPYSLCQRFTVRNCEFGLSPLRSDLGPKILDTGDVRMPRVEMAIRRKHGKMGNPILVRHFLALFETAPIDRSGSSPAERGRGLPCGGEPSKRTNEELPEVLSKGAAANLRQLTIKCVASGSSAADFAKIMNTTRMFERYSERAKAAACPSCRTVNMLGMMCAAAIDRGQFLAFVGRGYGGDWPDPRDSTERQPGQDLHLPRERR